MEETSSEEESDSSSSSDEGSQKKGPSRYCRDCKRCHKHLAWFLKSVYWLVISTLQPTIWACRFMIGSSDSDSEDDKRVIRSAKDRRFDELQATCHEIRVWKLITNSHICKQCLLLLVIGLCTLCKTELAYWLSLYPMLQSKINIAHLHTCQYRVGVLTDTVSHAAAEQSQHQRLVIRPVTV